MLIGCLAPNAEVAQQSAPAVFVIQLFFTGVFLPVTAVSLAPPSALSTATRPEPDSALHLHPVLLQIPAALRWIQWIASLKYAVALSYLIEFGPETQEHHDWGPAERAQADMLLELSDIYEDQWWFYLLMILVLFCAFRVLSIIALAWRARSFF